MRLLHGQSRAHRPVCRENVYDVLLMDIQMPEMDGFSVLELLRSSNIPQARSIPVVALTAHVNKEEEYLSARFRGTHPQAVHDRKPLGRRGADHRHPGEQGLESGLLPDPLR